MICRIGGCYNRCVNCGGRVPGAECKASEDIEVILARPEAERLQGRFTGVQAVKVMASLRGWLEEKRRKRQTGCKSCGHS